MSSNSFGNIFRFTTWGESHGTDIGVVIDGCPAGLQLNEEDINAELLRRAPGNSQWTSQRREMDKAQILSGVFEGKTTGTPISIVIGNTDVRSQTYTDIQGIPRPGHADYTYRKKYDVYDYRGGGRASARETACRVAAGTVARQLLSHENVIVTAYLSQVGDTVLQSDYSDASLEACISAAIAEGDSIGGTVTFRAENVPAGLGDPIYGKLDATLAYALMSIPAAKGIEIGDGFAAATAKGSECNDCYTTEDGIVLPATNHAGGILGGISTGMPIVGHVAFKPTSSIGKPQETVDYEGIPCVYRMPEHSRHDPCVAIRAVPVIEAMVAIVLADALLAQRSAKI